MEIENIVANTVLLKAREGVGQVGKQGTLIPRKSTSSKYKF